MLTLALLTLLAAQDEFEPPSKITIQAEGRTIVFDSARYRKDGAAIEVITEQSQPGVDLHLRVDGKLIEIDANGTQSVWLTYKRGGEVRDLEVNVTESGDRLRGTWSGRLFIEGRSVALTAGTIDVPLLVPLPALPEREEPRSVGGWSGNLSPEQSASAFGCCVMSFCMLGMGCIQVWFAVVAFRVHIGWGFAVLFLPVAPLVFTIVHWPEAKGPFITGLFMSGLTAVMFVLVILAHVV
jgi:hypothetical protein